MQNIFDRNGLILAATVKSKSLYVHNLSLNKKTKDKFKTTAITPEIEKVQRRLSSHFGTMIKIKSKNNAKGEISIPFASVNELNRILDLIEI